MFRVTFTWSRISSTLCERPSGHSDFLHNIIQKGQASVSGQSNSSVRVLAKSDGQVQPGPLALHPACALPAAAASVLSPAPCEVSPWCGCLLVARKEAFWTPVMGSGCGSLLWGSTAAFCPCGFLLMRLVLCKAVSWCSQKIYAPSLFET